MKTPEHPKVNRISFRYIADQLLQLFNLEKGMGYTIKWLTLNPRKAIHEYLYEDRQRMVKPFPFLVLVAAAGTFLTLTFIFKGGDFLNQVHSDPDWEAIPNQLKPVIDQLMLVTQKYFNLSYMSSIPFIALATFWVFKEDGLNYPEHIVINIYLYCMQTILLCLMIPILIKWPEIAIIPTSLLFAYVVYAYSNIFELKWWEGLGKTMLAYLIYTIFTSIFLSIFALLVLARG